MRKIHSVKYNFIMNFILTATTFIFPLITFPYVSRVLGPEGNGRVAFVSSVANYFIMIAHLGIPTYGVRACAAVRDDPKKLSKTIQEIFIINSVATFIVIISYIASMFIIPRFRDDRALFIINGINILLNLFGMNWVFQALEEYDYITFRSIAFKILSVLLMFILVKKTEDYVTYGAITVFAAVGSYVLNFYRITRIIKFERFSNYNIKIHLKPIFTLFAQSLAVSVYTNLDTVMLGFMKNDVEVGYYNAAIKIKNLLLCLVTSLGNVLLPRMSYYFKKGYDKLFNDTMIKALNFTSMLSIPLVSFFILFSREGMLFLAGEKYLGAVLGMQIITLAVIPNGLTGVLGVQVLTPMEKEKYVLYSVIIGAISDFILNLVLIPPMGAAGAALATTIAEFFVLIIQVFFLREHLKRIIKEIRILNYLFITGICIMVSLILQTASFPSAFIILLINYVVFFGIYGIALVITKEEIVINTIGQIKEKIRNKRGPKS